MEPNHKAKGRRHHQNKNRYRNKSKQVAQDVTPKPTRVLASNADRYEGDNEEAEPVSDFTNFSFLLQASASQGGHFQFKSDKNVESEFDFESFKKSKMFSLDLGLLDRSLSTIEFHERCGLDKSYLSESELEDINKRAQQSKVQYENYLEEISKRNEETSSESSESEENDAVEPEPAVVIPLNFNLVSKANCFNYIKQEKKETVQKDYTDNKEGLEEWLDDMLND